ncbi:MAG: DEAD/DEAH box helicase [Acidobacteriota bacterium]
MTQTAPIAFTELELSDPVVKGLATLGFTHPTEVQALVIPRILAGKDLLVQSRTGTGKTLAYGIPIVEKVDPAWPRVQALVLTPTRELALQVKLAVAALGKSRGVRAAALYGGDSMRRQMDEIRTPPQIVSATPGRLLDHLSRRTLSLSDCFWVVLDEADEMLSMGFYEEVERILRQVPRDRQTLLFSATLPQAVLSVAHNYLEEPERVSLSDDYLSVREIEHFYVISTEMEKERNLAKVLEAEDPDSCIIFCNTRDEARRVAGFLKGRRFQADLISGELTQRERERVMARIKAGKLKIMVATDVAARGIDVVGLSHVICFSTSESPEVYIHRTGRTGRVGKKGRAISMVSARDLHSFNRTEKANGLKIKEIDVPTDAQVRELRTHTMWERLRAYSEEHELDPDDDVSPLVSKILDGSEDSKAIVYALLKHFFEERKVRERAEPISVEAPEEGAATGDEAHAFVPQAQEEPPREGDRKKRRRRSRRGRGRERDGEPPATEETGAAEPEATQERRAPRGGSRERGGADRNEPRGFIVVALGASQGASSEELIRLVHRRGVRGEVKATVMAEETLIELPLPAALMVLEALADETLRGVRLMPMQLVGETSPHPAS